MIEAVEAPRAVIARKGADADAQSNPYLPTAHRGRRDYPAAPEPAYPVYDMHRCRARHLIEIRSSPKQFHRLAIRYDKPAKYFAAFVILAPICVRA